MMPSPRLWPDPFSPDAPPALAWSAWLAFAALVMAVGLLELALALPGRVAHRARWIVGGMLVDVGARVLPDLPPDPERHDRIAAGVAARIEAGRGHNEGRRG